MMLTGPILTVDLAAVARNLDRAQTLAPQAEVAPVVKANAYGLGALPIVRHLLRTKGVKRYFVAYREEAEALLASLDVGDMTFFVLNGQMVRDWDPHPDIIPVLNDTASIERWPGGPCGLGIDIGMARLGLTPEEARKTVASVGEQVTAVIMHFSDAADPDAPRTPQQAALAADIWQGLSPLCPNSVCSVSASAGLWAGVSGATHMTRPGIALYGGAPLKDQGTAGPVVATFEAPVIGVRKVVAGSRAGYGGLWEAKRDSTLAIIAVGYADGLPRSSWPKGKIWVGGAACPIAGAVSMDLTTVDVTDAPEGVRLGDTAEIFGGHLAIDDVAAASGTIAYERLTMIGPRVRRVYTNERVEAG